MLQNLLICHGSPTLANIKAAALMRIPMYSEFQREFDEIEAVLFPKGVHLTVLSMTKDNVLLYMYREHRLADILAQRDVQCFLGNYGYREFSIDAALRMLSERFTKTEKEEFPHEIGVFLDYPLSDVAAFILNKGKNCVCCGCWKAYTDQCGAMKTFARYAKCKEVYMRMFAAGVPMKRLAVRS